MYCIFKSLWLSLSLSVALCLSLCPSLCPSHCPSLCLFLCPSLCPSLSFSLSLSLSLSVSLSLHTYIHTYIHTNIYFNINEEISQIIVLIIKFIIIIQCLVIKWVFYVWIGLKQNIVSFTTVRQHESPYQRRVIWESFFVKQNLDSSNLFFSKYRSQDFRSFINNITSLASPAVSSLIIYK